MIDGGPDRPGVCILIGTFFPVVGGGETHARLLGRELVRRGIPVTVVTRRTAPALKRREIIDGMTVHRVIAPASPRMGKYMMLVPAVVRLIALRKEYDIVYVCALRVLGLAGLAAARLLGRKCVLRSEACGELSGDFIKPNADAGSARPLHPLIRRLLQWRNRFYMRADCFLSISHVIAEEFRQCGVTANQHRSISCGLDTVRFSPAGPDEQRRLRAELGLAPGFVFAYSGKLNRGKGLSVLLTAFKQVAERFEDVRLLLIGGGAQHSLSCEDELRAQISALQMDERVRLTGYVDNVEAYLRSVDAFAFPSLNESFGLAPLEAMACARPVVATRVGELPHIITDGRDGFLVVPGDVDALADAMIRVREDRQRAADMGRAARDTVVAKLGMGPVARQHVALFAELIE